MAIDLSKMNEKELTKLKGEIDKEMQSREKNRMSDARRAAEDAARKHGFSLGDLMGDKPARTARRSGGLPAKYRNPDDNSQTWSGRGRQPEWYKNALGAGKSPNDLTA